MLALLEVLARHRARFVVIGGVAVVQHGFSRTTRDLDIVPQPGARNIDRLWGALCEVDARPAELPSLVPRTCRSRQS